MDITLHTGAHRTATTSFQYYLRQNSESLTADGLVFWGPLRTRKGLFVGLMPKGMAPPPRKQIARVTGRVQLQLARARRSGAHHLLISDENFLGSARHCLRNCALYPAAGDRLARHVATFKGRISRIVVSVRSLELWWASCAAYSLTRGHAPLGPEAFDQIANSPRTWRDVITDIACAAPDVPIIVTPFEQFAGNAQNLLRTATGLEGPALHSDLWLNRSPDLKELRKVMAEQGHDPATLPEGDGRWQPFNEVQRARLREHYADDMHWLIAGAEGLATLAHDPTRTKTGQSLHAGILTEGNNGNDSGQGPLAQPG